MDYNFWRNWSWWQNCAIPMGTLVIVIAIGYWGKSPQAEKIREDEARRRDQEKRQQEQNRQK